MISCILQKHPVLTFSNIDHMAGHAGMTWIITPAESTALQNY